MPSIVTSGAMNAKALGFGASSGAADIGDAVNYSVRFNSADSPRLTKTFVSPTSNTVWSWSAWVKLSKLTVARFMFGGDAASNFAGLGFNSADQFNLWNNAGSTLASSTAVYRDPAKYGHMFWVSNGTTIKGYWNNVEVLSYTGTVTQLNSAIATNVGASVANGNYFDGYMADVCFVDGTALTPSSFGRVSADTGAWVHKNPSGVTWGTNGFRLQFNTGASASDLGTDTSGNGNTFTVTNLSVTAGVGNDWLTDTPTNTYCTVNPLVNRSGGSILNGALQVVTASGAGFNGSYCSTMAMAPNSGKWYAEMTVTSTAGYASVGLCAANSNFTASNPPNGLAIGVVYRANGNKYVNTAATAYGATYTTGDVIGIEYDATALSVTFFKNGTSQGAITGLTSTDYLFVCGEDDYSAQTYYWNFGQRAFARTPNSDFLALCTANLPTPAIGATAATQASKHFAINLRTGTAASYSVTGIGFQPDLVWVKSRGRALDHAIYDSVRGVQKQLESNTTTVESTETTGLTAFNSDGYTGGALDQMNGTTATNSFIDWMWKGGGAGVSNTNGTISSTVSANTLAGISVVTYTGTGANATVGHGLGVAPKLVIVKARNATQNWTAWHTSFTSTEYIFLNSTAAKSSSGGAAIWNSTTPSSTVFSIGTDTNTNWNGSTDYLAYCFAEVEGFSKIGSYVGNGSSDGPFVWCGFRPRFIMVKAASSTGHWVMIDTARDTYNASDSTLAADLSSAEAPLAATSTRDILSNGFKPRLVYVGYLNDTGVTYIFYAIAETPFKYANGR